MASVQVRILQSGRTDAYGLPLTPGSVVTVDRDYAVSLISAGFASWVNPADAYDGETNLRKPSESYVLFQSGIPFWIPPGDGGSNGLSLAADGTFTLSAESPMASAFNVLASGGYCYLPAGAGGLVAGGWFWCRMTDGTNGQVFRETYPGTGQPAFVSSPTPFTGLTPGRITQLTSEIIGPSFTMPGGSPGPNGTMSFLLKWLTSSTAGSKTIRCRAGNATFFDSTLTATLNDQLFKVSRINMGVETRQIGNRTGSTSGAWDGSAATAYLGDVTTLNTAVDQTVFFAGRIIVNTDSIMLIPMLFEVKYGA